jgi:phenylalanyl-tRNA synthetase beta chain
LKSHIDNIFLKLGLKKEYKTPENIKDARLKEVQEIWLNDQPAGVYGKINKKGSSLPDIRQDVWYAELDWSLLHEQSKKTRIIYKEIPRYPFVRRDLALILDKSVPFAEVEQAADSLKSNILEKVNLFDVFESEKLGKDKKSYAVSFIFRHPERTLTDKEIDKVMTKLITLFGSRLNAEIRS